MIIWFLILVFASYGRLSGLSVITLVVIILAIRAITSLAIYWKLGSILSLIWILVYLGGMIVVFVYILFMRLGEKGETGYPNVRAKHLKTHPFWCWLCFIIIFKWFATLWWREYGSSSISWVSRILHREGYIQISPLSTRFFLLSTVVLLYSLFQVLNILNLKNKATQSSFL